MTTPETPPAPPGAWLSVWIFTAATPEDVWPETVLPVAAFSTFERGARWATIQAASGMFTEYPLDVGIYEWTVSNGYFKPRREDQRTAQFIRTFSSAYQRHVHIERGRMDGHERARWNPASVPFAWIFNGYGRRRSYPSAVFSDQQRAREWIATIGVSGVLTRVHVHAEGDGRLVSETYVRGHLDAPEH